MNVYLDVRIVHEAQRRIWKESIHHEATKVYFTEIEFANLFEGAQLDVERREKNSNKRRTMLMWRNAIEHTWKTRPMSEIHKLIDRQPKIQKAIVEAKGDRVNF